ncbi:hypothetical protein Tco_0257622 [Tanacetum coccineum]
MMLPRRLLPKMTLPLLYALSKVVSAKHPLHLMQLIGIWKWKTHFPWHVTLTLEVVPSYGKAMSEYECSFLALAGEERRDEKKILDHLKQDQTMLVIKRFSKRKKIFRERKKTGKIRAKRLYLIYMHQFWYTIAKDPNTQSYHFMLDDQKFEVGVELLCEDPNTQSYHFMLDDQKFEVGVELLCKVLQITLRNPNQEFVDPPSHDELVSFIKQLGYSKSLELTLEIFFIAMMLVELGEDGNKRTKGVVFLFYNNYDIVEVLGKLKSVNKGEEQQKYGMLISDSMMNDTITNSSDYLKEKKKDDVPRKKRSLTTDYNILPDPDEALKLDESINLIEAEEQEEERCLHETHASIIIRREANLEANKNADEHQKKKKLKSVATEPKAAQLLLNLKKGNKSDWGSDDKVEVISSDDERTKTDGSEKIVDEEIAEEDKANDEKAGDVKDADGKADDEKNGDQKADDDKAGDEHAEVLFLNDSSNISLVGILKDPVQTEIQSMVDVHVHQENPTIQQTSLVDAIVSMLPELEKKVDAMSKINHADTIEEYVQANVINEVKNQLSKKVIYFFYTTNILSYNNAFIGSMGIDEAIAKGDLDLTKTLKKRCNDDQDPPVDSGKEKTKGN